MNWDLHNIDIDLSYKYINEKIGKLRKMSKEKLS